MKFCALVLAIVFSTSVFSSVVSSYDRDSDCVVYRVTSDETPKGQGENYFFDKEVYGFSLQNMSIDFESRTVNVDSVMNVIMGFNRPLLPGKLLISGDNPEFNFLINQLNRKLYLFEKMCIRKGNQLIYARMLEVKDTAKLRNAVGENSHE
jgi:hypothetical protein